MKLAIISCEYAFDWTVDYLDHFATIRVYARASALLVSLFHRVFIAQEQKQAGACNNAVTCSATRWFVLLIKRTYHVD